MKILLTGSHGFVGTHFRENAPKDWEFSNWDLKIDKPVSQITVADMKGVDAVVHLAAYISVPHSYEDPIAYCHNNTYLTFDLAKKAVDAGVKRFVFASSSSVYGDPLSPYGASKLAAEEFISVYKDVMEVISLRFFNIYGKGQNKEYAGVITKFMEALDKGEPLVIYGDGHNTRDFTYVKDVAQVLVSACKLPVRNDTGPLMMSKPIEIGKGYSNSINDLVRIMGEVWNVPVTVQHAEARKEIRNSMARSSNIFLSMFTPLKEGLRLLYNETHV